MSDRIIRDEILRSHRFVGLSSDTLRLVFIAFVLCADDLGNAEATATAMGIMMVRHVPEEVSAKWLGELADVDLVRIYEAGDKRYVHLPRFRQRLRYSSGKHPRPPENIECNEIKQLAQKVRPRTVSSPTVVGPESAEVKRSEEKRSKPSRAKSRSLAQPDGFAEFWSRYPKHKGRSAAVKAWQGLNPDENLQRTILAAIAVQAKTDEWIRERGQFIPYPATWLNGRRWEDELLPVGKPRDWT